jgi:phthiocerol/phenolphthiocerol synthesis type-I polyketide synthase D
MLGLDSLGATQLRQRLQRALDLTIDLAVLWTKPTAAGLTDWILQRMGHTPESDDSGPPEPQ